MQIVWNHGPVELVLPFSQVHVWSAALIEYNYSHGYRAMLSPQETERAKAFRDDRARLQFLTGRIVLREILGRYLGVTPQKIKFNRSARGKLSLGAPLENEIEFNLSHSADVILLAFARERKLGVDIEKIETLSEAIAIAKNFFSPIEAAAVAAEEHAENIFFKYWTRKEAILKCTGHGIDDSTSRTTDSFDGTVVALEPMPGYAAALAVSGAEFKLKTWHWLPPRKDQSYSLGPIGEPCQDIA